MKSLIVTILFLLGVAAATSAMLSAEATTYTNVHRILTNGGAR